MSAYCGDKKNKKVMLTVERNGSPVLIPVQLNEDGKMFPARLSPKEYDSLGYFKIQHTDYGFFSAFPAGFTLAINSLKDYIDQFKLILSPKTEAYKGLSGFKGMANVFDGNGWDWQGFWSITALFSIILAFMNLLPIPALDGGHVLFTLIEMITGRKPSEKFLEYAQIAGMIFLLALMLYANGNDWFGWGRGKG
jgi:regulator of sigma E protease